MSIDVKQIAVKVSLVLMGTLPCTGQATTKPYAQMLVNETLLRNANISTLSMAVPNPTTKENRVVASSNAAAIGNEADKYDLDVLAGNRPVTTPDIANHRCQALVPLHDASGATIGVLRASFNSHKGAPNECEHEAE